MYLFYSPLRLWPQLPDLFPFSQFILRCCDDRTGFLLEFPLSFYFLPRILDIGRIRALGPLQSRRSSDIQVRCPIHTCKGTDGILRVLHEIIIYLSMLSLQLLPDSRDQPVCPAALF